MKKEILKLFVITCLFTSAQISTADTSAEMKIIMHGAIKYSSNCASCHGPLAQGAANWHVPDKNGNYPPPPLNGTGHAWHHKKEVMTRIIKKGGKPTGGVMPAFETKLSDTDINSIIAWLQSHWPEEIRETWKKNNIK